MSNSKYYIYTVTKQTPSSHKSCLCKLKEFELIPHTKKGENLFKTRDQGNPYSFTQTGCKFSFQKGTSLLLSDKI